MTTSALFTPFSLGALRLPHRVVMAPMTRNRAEAQGLATPLMAEYYAQRASAALIVSEATQIAPEGVGYPSTPGIHDAAQVRAWAPVVSAVHARGGRFFVQLWHAGRISHPTLQPEGAPPVAPSAIAPRGNALTTRGLEPYHAPRALSTREVAGVVEQYAHAARRALEAGFDGVEIHAANGYLIEQFLVDGANTRSDAYGGSIGNRVRFLSEVTEAVIDAVGAERVGVKLSPRSTFNDIHDSDRAALFQYAAQRLNELRPLYLHVVDPLGPDKAADASAPRIAPALRRIFRGPFIVNGGFDRDTAEAALTQGEADLVSFGVGFLGNPDLPERLRRRAPLNTPERATFYGGGRRGYTDYPVLE